LKVHLRKIPSRNQSVHDFRDTRIDLYTRYGELINGPPWPYTHGKNKKASKKQKINRGRTKR